MLQLANITKSFAGCFAPVLKTLNLAVAKGEFCMLIGCNGSGKSTLIRSISGEYSIDSGNILINNVDLTNRDRSQLIATVTQDINKGTIPEMTLLENMVLSNLRSKSATYTRYRKYRATAIAQITALGIGLENYIDKPLSSLSGGQRQMIATLMAVNSNPQLLLLDEHTSALDPKMQKLLMEYTMRAVMHANITSMMVTHKLDDAIQYGNRLIMLHEGKIVFDVAGMQKAELTVPELLALFHKYEDLTLTANAEVQHAN